MSQFFTNERAVPMVCERCGQAFNARAHQVKIGRGRWCSSACYNASRSMARRKPRADFWSYVDASAGEDGCWPWKMAKCPQGYGLWSQGKSCKKAHRIAFALSGGVLSQGQVVRHTCDNTSCCNPKHLIPGTQKDNVRDAIERGRWPTGDAWRIARGLPPKEGKERDA